MKTFVITVIYYYFKGMKSSNCNTWIDNEVEAQAPMSGTEINGSMEGGPNKRGSELPLKKQKRSVWGRVIGSVLVVFIEPGFKREANFEIGRAHV